MQPAHQARSLGFVPDDYKHGADRQRQSKGRPGGQKHAKFIPYDARCAVSRSIPPLCPPDCVFGFWGGAGKNRLRAHRRAPASLIEIGDCCHRGCPPVRQRTLSVAQRAHRVHTAAFAPAELSRKTAMAAERSRRTPLPFYGDVPRSACPECNAYLPLCCAEATSFRIAYQ